RRLLLPFFVQRSASACLLPKIYQRMHSRSGGPALLGDAHQPRDIQDQGDRTTTQNGGARNALHFPVVFLQRLDDDLLLPEQVIDDDADPAVITLDDDNQAFARRPGLDASAEE